jgi:hypothetical protein
LSWSTKTPVGKETGSICAPISAEAFFFEMVLQKTKLSETCNNTRRKVLAQKTIKMPFINNKKRVIIEGNSTKILYIAIKFLW